MPRSKAAARARRVDIHAHVLPRELPDFKARFGYGGFIRLHHRPNGAALMARDDGKPFREVGPELFDDQARLRRCDETGVTMQVVSTVPVMFSYWAKPKDALYVTQYLNDDVARLVDAHPRRFIGLGTLPLQDPDLAVKELRRCMSLGLAGAEIGTNVEGKNLDDAGLFAVFAAAADLGASLFVHPWYMMGADQLPKYWLPWLVAMPAETSRAICSMIFGGVLERLPKLRVAFAHGGGAFPGTIGRIGHGFEARPDLCAVDNARHPREYLGRFYVDALVHDAAALRGLVELVGRDKVALGSDYPFPLGEDEPGALIDSMKWPTALKKKLLWDNAMGWLGKKA